MQKCLWCQVASRDRCVQAAKLDPLYVHLFGSVMTGPACLGAPRFRLHFTWTLILQVWVGLYPLANPFV